MRARLLWLVVAALAMWAFLAIGLPRLLEFGLGRALEGQGLEPRSLRVASLGLDHVELADLELGSPPLSIGRLRIAVSWASLRERRAELVLVEDVSLRGLPATGADDEEGGLDLGTLAALLPRRLRVSPLHIGLDSPSGRLEGDGSLDLAFAANGGIEGEADLRLRLGALPVAELAILATPDALVLAVDGDLGNDTLIALAWNGGERVRIEGRVEAPASTRIAPRAMLAAAEGLLSFSASGRWDDADGRAEGSLAWKQGALALDATLRGRGPGPARWRDVTVKRLSLTGELPIDLAEDTLTLRTGPCLAWRLEDARQADLRATLGGCLTDDPDALLRLEGEAGAQHLASAARVVATDVLVDRAGEPLLRGRLPELHWKMAGPVAGTLGLRAGATGGDLRLGGDLARVSKIDASWQTGQEIPISAELRLGPDPGGRALRVEAAVTQGDPVLVRGTVADREGALRVRADASVDPVTMSAHAEVQLEPLRFSVDGLQPQAYQPGLLASFGAFEGELEGAARLSYASGTFGGTADVTLREGGVAAPAYRLRGVEGRLAFGSLWPLETLPDQRLSFASLLAGLSLENGTLTLIVGPGWQRVRIEDLRGLVAGGELRLDGELDLEREQHRAQVELRGLALPKLVELAGRDDLSATGTLAGSLPVTLDRGALGIRGGKIYASSPKGRIRYRPDAPPPALAGAGDYGDLVMKALDDFHYDTLEVSLDVAPTGESQIVLSLRGANPALEDGRPVHLTLDLSGPLLAVAESLPRMRELVDRVGSDALRSDDKRRSR